jgi:DNA repair protein RecO (recombination protein O)
MALHQTPALVIKKTPLGEEDLIVTFYTSMNGKVKGVARGALRSRNPWRGCLEPFNILKVTLFSKGSSTLWRLSDVELMTRFPEIIKSLPKLESAYEILQCIDKFVPEAESNAGLFELISDCFHLFEHDRITPEIGLICFHLKFFQISGYQFHLDHCIVCKKPRNQQAAFFLENEGSVICKTCKKNQNKKAPILSGKTLNLIDDILSGRFHGNTADVAAFQSSISEINAVIRNCYAFHFDEYPNSGKIFGNGTM